VFFLLLSPIMWFSHTLFLVGLPFGKVVGWIGQVRDDHTVPWLNAFQQFWPHTLLGLGSVAALAVSHPSGIPYALLIAGGPLLSIPLAVITAKPWLGAMLARIGIGRLPEETAPPGALAALALPALAAVRSA
jgi:membrane glycosyltransferase